ncbi:MAG: HipA N-terminal domain-containing protein [Bacteroidetes bacterium]|nr:HipA N-terminal domain-containing protein [Bacteroidota bacterium]
MRCLAVWVSGIPAGTLDELDRGKVYQFTYNPAYTGPSVSLTMPISDTPYQFTQFPPFFEGLLPEGIQLEALLRARKIDRDDLFSQLAAVGADMVGAVTVTVEDPKS